MRSVVFIKSGYDGLKKEKDGSLQLFSSFFLSFLYVCMNECMQVTALVFPFPRGVQSFER